MPTNACMELENGLPTLECLIFLGMINQNEMAELLFGDVAKILENEFLLENELVCFLKHFSLSNLYLIGKETKAILNFLFVYFNSLTFFVISIIEILFIEVIVRQIIIFLASHCRRESMVPRSV